MIMAVVAALVPALLNLSTGMIEAYMFWPLPVFGFEELQKRTKIFG